jgi:parallel beta-helix repeat protein
MNNNVCAFAFFGLALLTSAAGLQADTIPGGDVSGVWYAANSPYYVTGDLTIQADDTLTIEPGVEVVFQGNYSLTVYGLLEAVGTETDSIHFLPADTSSFWRGIRFSNAPDSSHMVYCTVSHVGQMFLELCGIICTNSNPVIRHCRISDNKAKYSTVTYAAGITLNNSNPEIAWCNIINNVGGYYAGGIYLINSSPVITGCNISGNRVSEYGGGVYILGNSNPIITNCKIENDTSYMYGGGIAVLGGAVTISECTVGYNYAETGGGGISIHGGSVFLDHCIIEHNKCLYIAAGKGGGIFTNGGVLTVDHCTFSENEVSNSYPNGMEIHTEGNAAMTVTNSIFLSIWDFWTIVFNSTVIASVSYNDFWCGWGSGNVRFIGNVPPGLGVLTQVNTNGDTCDVYYNIFLDPLFEDPYTGNYQITWANWATPDSTKSPCIDAGDPAFACDPDSTVTDMGAYWFDQRAPAAAVSDTVLDFGVVTVGSQDSLGLTIYNLGTANLMISGLANSLPVFTTNYDPADSLVPPGDSLALTVTFAPSDTFPACDTLIIANKDHSLAVALSGTGLPTGVAGRPEPALPKAFALHPCRPNPARGFTSISYQLPKECRVELEIYGITGQLVKRFDEGMRPPGYYSVPWNTARQPAGVYFYRLKAGTFAATRKLVVIR